MTKKRDDGTVVDRSPGFVDDTPRRRARRMQQTERFDGDDLVVTRGHVQFRLSKKRGLKCLACGKEEHVGNDSERVRAFYEAHEHPERAPAPPAAGPVSLEQLFADIRELAELKGDGDELEVLSVITRRLKAGLQVYGKLRVDADARDFVQEALEEAADGMIYSAIGLLRGRRKAGA